MVERIRLAVTDIETGGLVSAFSEIVEVAIIVIDLYCGEDFKWEYERVTHFHSLIKPHNPERIHPDALKVNGLKLEELMEAPSSFDVRGNLLTWWREVLQEQQLQPLGHNYSFDRKFLEVFLGDTYQYMFNYHNEDTYATAKLLSHTGRIQVENEKDFSLAGLCATLDVTHKPHTALNDARATADLYVKLLDLV